MRPSIFGIILIATIICESHSLEDDYTFYSSANAWLKFHEVPTDWDTAQLQCSLEESHSLEDDYTFYSSANAWLKFHEVPTDWDTAQLQCSLEGAMLASSTTRLITALNRASRKFNPPQGVFTGIRYCPFSRTFHSLEGIPLNEIPHKLAKDKGELNNFNGHKECLVLHNEVMVDEECNKNYPYICYKNRTELQCGKEDGYRFSPISGSFYKIHTNPQTWDQSNAICAEEGANLAIINSHDEAMIIKDIFSDYNETVSSEFSKTGQISVRIGFRNVQGDWITVEDKSISEAGYNVWSENEPNNDNKNQQCGGVYWKTFLLDDIECELGYMFICEKKDF